jgi:DNA repair ATPase RecN
MILTGTNFQSWEDFKIEIDKLTVITGPSDVGKSAIFRSLKALVRNELSADYIRVGQNSCTITLNNPQGTFSISRGNKSSSKYAINGVKLEKEIKLEKLNEAIPKEIKDLGMNIIEIGEKKLDPIFAGQHDTQFMLQGIGPTELNSILGAFSSTEKLEFGKREANSRIAQCNSEAKTLALESQEAENRKFKVQSQLDKIKPLTKIILNLEELDEGFRIRLSSLEEVVGLKENLKLKSFFLKKIKVPDLTEIINQQSVVRLLNDVVVFSNRKNLGEEIISKIDTGSEIWSRFVTLYKISSTIEDILETGKSLSLKKKLIKLSEDQEKTSDRIDFISRQQTLVYSLIKMRGLIASVGDIKKQQQVLDLELQSLSEQVQDLEKITCPGCGKRFNPKHECE